MTKSTKKWVLFFTALILMTGTAGALTWLKTHQKLGAPGVQATAISDQVKMQLELPERVLDFTSTNMPEPETVLGYLPKDTSYVGRRYSATNWLWTDATLILMGEDRTSIHRADYCLPGQGWQIREKSVVNLAIAGAHPYELPVSKWVIAQTFTAPDGRQQPISGIYVFWYVTKDETTCDFTTMLKSMFIHLVRHGVLQRWAYASYFTPCQPGQEDATFARMKELIAAMVPEFQLSPATAK